MSKLPSPSAHLIRLAMVLVAGFIIFVGLKIWQTPDTWNFEVWYRGGTLEDMKKLPRIHGGNESCKSCHADEYEDATSYKHKTLNCEGCHGELSKHIKDDKKIGDAKGKDNWVCLNCHEERISRPKDHKQFPGKVKRHQGIKAGTFCVKCHDPHDPAM